MPLLIFMIFHPGQSWGSCQPVCQHRCLPTCDLLCCITTPFIVPKKTVKILEKQLAKAHLKKKSKISKKHLKKGHVCEVKCQKACLPSCKFSCCITPKKLVKHWIYKRFESRCRPEGKVFKTCWARSLALTMFNRKFQILVSVAWD